MTCIGDFTTLLLVYIFQVKEKKTIPNLIYGQRTSARNSCHDARFVELVQLYSI